MAFTDTVWTIPTALAWIATRDRSEVDRLEYETTRSLSATAVLVPGALPALPEFLAKAADGAIAVNGITADGRREQIDKLAFAHAEITEDERGLVVASWSDGETQTSWTRPHVLREAVLAVWPSPVPVWPLFRDVATLRDFAATIEPAKTARWAELAALLAIPGEVHSSKYRYLYTLRLQISGSITIALMTGQYCLEPAAAVLNPDNEVMSWDRWPENIADRLEIPAGAENRSSDHWRPVQQWRDMTVRCTDTALQACPDSALHVIVQCPQIPVRPASPVISKRLPFLQVVLTKTDAFIVAPRWLPMPRLFASWIEWIARKLYWPSR